VVGQKSPRDRPRPGRDWFEPSPRAAVAEPTQMLPLVAPPPTAVARAVIVYQERPRRPWLLWVFTMALVALTVGVVLGQTVAFEPVYRSAAGAQAAPVPAEVLPSPSQAAEPWPDAAHRVTAPLGAVRERQLEVVGASTVLRIRSVDLGDVLFDIATIDRGAVPSVTESDKGSRLELIRTDEPGTVGAEIQLNAKVAWVLKLPAGSSEQFVDLREGRVAGVGITGGTAQLVLQLPEPKGTVPVRITGPVGDLAVRTRSGTPVRVRLRGGATTAVLEGKAPRKIKAGGALTTAGWSTAENRYDVVVTGAVVSVSSAVF
jgi:hypothetical protein